MAGGKSGNIKVFGERGFLWKHHDIEAANTNRLAVNRKLADEKHAQNKTLDDLSINLSAHQKTLSAWFVPKHATTAKDVLRGALSPTLDENDLRPSNNIEANEKAHEHDFLANNAAKIAEDTTIISKNALKLALSPGLDAAAEEKKLEEEEKKLEQAKQDSLRKRLQRVKVVQQPKLQTSTDETQRVHFEPAVRNIETQGLDISLVNVFNQEFKNQKPADEKLLDELYVEHDFALNAHFESFYQLELKRARFLKENELKIPHALSATGVPHVDRHANRRFALQILKPLPNDLTETERKNIQKVQRAKAENEKEEQAKKTREQNIEDLDKKKWLLDIFDDLWAFMKVPVEKMATFLDKLHVVSGFFAGLVTAGIHGFEVYKAYLEGKEARKELKEIKNPKDSEEAKSLLTRLYSLGTKIAVGLLGAGLGAALFFGALGETIAEFGGSNIFHMAFHWEMLTPIVPGLLTAIYAIEGITSWLLERKATKALEAAEAKLVDHIAEHEKSQLALQNEIEQLYKELAGPRKLLAEKNQELAVLQRQLAEKRKNADAKDDDIEIATLIAALEAKKDEILQLRTDINVKKNVLETKLTAHATIQGQRDALEENVKDLHEKRLAAARATFFAKKELTASALVTLGISILTAFELGSKIAAIVTLGASAISINVFTFGIPLAIATFIIVAGVWYGHKWAGVKEEAGKNKANCVEADKLLKQSNLLEKATAGIVKGILFIPGKIVSGIVSIVNYFRGIKAEAAEPQPLALTVTELGDRVKARAIQKMEKPAQAPQIEIRHAAPAAMQSMLDDEKSVDGSATMVIKGSPSTSSSVSSSAIAVRKLSESQTAAEEVKRATQQQAVEDVPPPSVLPRSVSAPSALITVVAEPTQAVPTVAVPQPQRKKIDRLLALTIAPASSREDVLPSASAVTSVSSRGSESSNSSNTPSGGGSPTSMEGSPKSPEVAVPVVDAAPLANASASGLTTFKPASPGKSPAPVAAPEPLVQQPTNS